jgi:very-short-patch-repair endonuclease
VRGDKRVKRGNIQKSRQLRRNQTDAEKKLWDLLRNRQFFGVKFRRQFSVSQYILDFYSPQFKPGIEADGGHHYANEWEEKDQRRTEELAKLGIKILRFNDYEILNNTQGVAEFIQGEIGKIQ